MTERVSRIWNAAALVFVGVLAATPADFLSEGPDSAWEYVASGVGAILVAGFWFAMLFECFRSKGLPMRGFWLVLFLLVPIFSAFIYFSTTRSWRSDGTYRVSSG